ncbi:protein NRT1/ PTR FAMILY 3.1-like [Rutidosis leptorrhynchoides]|uniref:protein NRT1/ PTR FAMILY 3.1-like n=1 Tax=Rutidosis leptorrhynchoides TaxID=125765 RepID=UPI003A9A599A
MISYLTQELHMPITKAANTFTNFSGTGSLTPLLGAFMADSFAGRFWTITVASIIYQIGLVSLTFSAVLPKLRPPPCKDGEICKEADTGQVAILYISLMLLALGSGGIRPCVAAFGADQFDETDEKQKSNIWKFFNWYYFGMGVSMLVAVTVIVYIQDNIGWGWGIGVPTIAMAFSILGFVFGYPLYRHIYPVGSPFARLIQVCVAAYRKRNLPMVSDPKLLYENEELDASISVSGKLLHTEELKFLDKAAIVTTEDFPNNQTNPNLWRLNTVHRVEELKSLIRMGPIWAAGIILMVAYVQQCTFSIQQAKSMNRIFTKSFEIPAGSMTVFTLISMLISVILYDRVFIPVTRKLTGLDRGVSFLTRMAIGFGLSVFATFVAGFVEIKRKNAASAYGLTYKPHETIPISVFWLVPQYTLHGLAEAFMSIGHLEFLYDQSPESMRSTATALYWTANAVGNYGSTLLVTMVHKMSAGQDGSNWLPDDNLNKGKLEYFYWLITLLQVFNLVYYLICTKYYTLKPIQVVKKAVEDENNNGKDDGVELGNSV